MKPENIFLKLLAYALTRPNSFYILDQASKD